MSPKARQGRRNVVSKGPITGPLIAASLGIHYYDKVIPEEGLGEEIENIFKNLKEVIFEEDDTESFIKYWLDKITT